MTILLLSADYIADSFHQFWFESVWGGSRVKAAPLSMLIKVTGIWNTVHTAKVLRKRAERVKENKLDTQDEAR